MVVVWFILGFIVVAGIGLLMYVMGIYNSLVNLRARYKNAFAQIEVQLKRRYDLIPNLVETAKGYMKHESETLENVIKAGGNQHIRDQWGGKLYLHMVSALEASVRLLAPALPEMTSLWVGGSRGFGWGLIALVSLHTQPEL